MLSVIGKIQRSQNLYFQLVQLRKYFFLALTNDEEVVEQNGDYTFFHDTKEKTASDSFSSSGSQTKLLP